MSAAGWVVNSPAPRLEIRKVEGGWYTYLVSVNGNLLMGQGTRGQTEDAVTDFLRRWTGTS